MICYLFSVPENEDDLDDETHALLQADWEIGEVIRQSIVPRAVLLFTGEAMDDYDEEDDEESEGYGDEDEEDSDADEEYSPPKSAGHKKKGKSAGAGHKNKGGDGDKPPECKQQ